MQIRCNFPDISYLSETQKNNFQFLSKPFSMVNPWYTRGLWKVLSMVLYLSNRFTNPIMFGIILKSYLSSLLWHKYL